MTKNGHNKPIFTWWCKMKSSFLRSSWIDTRKKVKAEVYQGVGGSPHLALARNINNSSLQTKHCCTMYCSTLLYTFVYCFILLYSMLYTALYKCTMLYITLHCCTLLNSVVLCLALLFTSIHWCTVYYTVLHCYILWYTVVICLTLLYTSRLYTGIRAWEPNGWPFCFLNTKHSSVKLS